MRARAAAVVLAFGVCPLPAVAQPARMGPALTASLADPRPGAPHVVWVYFKDKGPAAQARIPELPAVSVSAQARRERRGQALARHAFEDLALERSYVEEVALRVLRVRHELRWFNAVSVEATSEQVRALAALPFVEKLELVRGFRRGAPEAPPASAPGFWVPRKKPDPPKPDDGDSTTAYDYGPSLGQLAQINVPAVHSLGFHGEGIVIAVFDTGFDNLGHEAFAGTQITQRHDFVNGDADVANGADMGEGSHGTATLSTIGGFKPGQIVGPAFAATFLLAKTENTDSETPVEEDNWAAAAEWAERLGADVISCSLGYLDFDAPFPSYRWSDMDGDTAISTRAADLAAERGVVVVASAGNNGSDPNHNTLGAPADGHRVIAAAAVTSWGSRASFSSVGPSADGRVKPDVAAQGQNVYAAGSGYSASYQYVDGTSFSCPLTAGVAALVLQAHPSYSVDQVIAVLRSTASQATAPDNRLGWGIVNALAAVQAAAPVVRISSAR
jgi:serine protease AprX